MTTRQFGRYIIKKKLGQGGMGVVVLAYDPHREVDVAIKILPAPLTTDANFRLLFDREVKTIVRLEHYAIVPVYDFGELESRPFLAMRLMKGGSLADRLGRGELALGEIDGILKRLCSALDKAHDNGVIHQDIKPGNILFDDQGEAYLADFGIAHLSGDATIASFVGTPHYMAPEQAKGERPTTQTDIYQLGVVLFEMLSGQTPFQGSSPDSLLYQHVHVPVPDITAYGRALPSGLRAVVEKALAKDPNKRYRTAGELAAAYHAALTGKKGQRTGIWQLGKVLAVAALTIALFLAVFGDPPNGPPEPVTYVPELVAADASANLTPTDRVPTPPTTTVPASPSPTPTDRPSATPTPSPTPTIAPDLGGGTGLLSYVSDEAGAAQIYSLAVSGGAATRLAMLPGDMYRPVWSPDGRRLALHVFVNSNWEIYTMNADGTGIANITNNPKDDSFPAWSPDGSMIAFHSNRAVDFDIYIMGADGATPFALTDNDVDDFGPSWAPDGSAIVFDRRQGNARQLVRLTLPGFVEEQLTFVGSNEFAAWSPDGKNIAFESDRDGNWEIYVMDVDGSNLRRLTYSLYDDFYAAWSPDSQWLAFHENIDGDRNIFIAKADGSQTYQWLASAADERQPSWQPRPHALPPMMLSVLGADCSFSSDMLADIRLSLRVQLGCPVADEIVTWAARERFQNGQMFWREIYDTAQMLVLFNSGSWQIVPYDSFVEGVDPEFACVDANTPAMCPPTPKRGFGKMWCSNGAIRQNIGNALDCEQGFTATIQLFERGSILRTDEGTIYILAGVNSGSWEQH